MTTESSKTAKFDVTDRQQASGITPYSLTNQLTRFFCQLVYERVPLRFETFCNNFLSAMTNSKRNIITIERVQ